MTEREILNVDEAAQLLGVSVKTFNKVLHAEDVPARKIGREWKFSRQALIDWVGKGRARDFYREQGGRSDELVPARRDGALHDNGGAPRAEPRSRAYDEDGRELALPQRRRTAGWQIEME